MKVFEFPTFTWMYGITMNAPVASLSIRLSLPPLYPGLFISQATDPVSAKLLMFCTFMLRCDDVMLELFYYFNRIPDHDLELTAPS